MKDLKGISSVDATLNGSLSRVKLNHMDNLSETNKILVTPQEDRTAFRVSVKDNYGHSLENVLRRSRVDILDDFNMKVAERITDGEALDYMYSHCERCGREVLTEGKYGELCERCDREMDKSRSESNEGNIFDVYELKETKSEHPKFALTEIDIERIKTNG